MDKIEDSIPAVIERVLAMKRVQIETVMTKDPDYGNCLVKAISEIGHRIEDGRMSIEESELPAASKRATEIYLESLPAPVAAIIQEALAPSRV